MHKYGYMDIWEKFLNKHKLVISAGQLSNAILTALQRKTIDLVDIMDFQLQ